MKFAFVARHRFSLAGLLDVQRPRDLPVRFPCVAHPAGEPASTGNAAILAKVRASFRGSSAWAGRSARKAYAYGSIVAPTHRRAFRQDRRDRFVDVERLQGGVTELVLLTEMPDAGHETFADPGRLLVLGETAKAGLWPAHGLDGRPEPFPVRRRQRHHGIADIGRIPAERGQFIDAILNFGFKMAF